MGVIDTVGVTLAVTLLVAVAVAVYIGVADGDAPNDRELVRDGVSLSYRIIRDTHNHVNKRRLARARTTS